MRRKEETPLSDLVMDAIDAFVELKKRGESEGLIRPGRDSANRGAVGKRQTKYRYGTFASHSGATITRSNPLRYLARIY